MKSEKSSKVKKSTKIKTAWMLKTNICKIRKGKGKRRMKKEGIMSRSRRGSRMKMWGCMEKP